MAGKQKGIEHGKRSSLWSEVVRAAGSIRPRYIVLENVAAIITSSGGGDIRRVCGDLATLGYDSEWAIVRASDVGAPHQRARWFCIAWQQSTMGNAEYFRFDPTQEPRGNGSADDQCKTRQNITSESKGTGGTTQISELADTFITGLQRNGRYEQSTREQHPSPGRIFHDPKRSNYWNNGVRNKNGRLIEPSIPLLADGIPDRVARIKAFGNAIVPQVAEHVGECLKRFDKARRANQTNILSR